MNKRARVLVLGGYGNFGARICRALAGDKDIQVCVAGRNIAAAQALADTLPGQHEAVVIDVLHPDLAETLARLNLHTVIHTAGPFQDQGYAVAHACANAGVHYIDLADGRRFVCDFPKALQAAFAQAGRVAISGASTVPALSSAVVSHLSAGWQTIERIDICIAPAQTAPRGVATLAAVLSYCGRPVRLWADGRWQDAMGWAAPSPAHFARMKPRLAAVCDIPDLELFPTHFSVTRSVRFRAALEVGLSQRAFAWLAAGVQRGWIRHPESLAPLLHRWAPLFDRLGSSLGGMYVRVEGRDRDDRPVQRTWHITADHDHGPEIPTMAAILLTRELVRSSPWPAGAYTATGRLPLSAFEPEFARWGMVTDVR